jgi:hypothetical protein
MRSLWRRDFASCFAFPKFKRAQQTPELFADSFFGEHSRLRSRERWASSRMVRARDHWPGRPRGYPGGGPESATNRRQSRRIAEAVRSNQRNRREIVRTASFQFAAFKP